MHRGRNWKVLARDLIRHLVEEQMNGDGWLMSRDVFAGGFVSLTSDLVRVPCLVARGRREVDGGSEAGKISWSTP